MTQRPPATTREPRATRQRLAIRRLMADVPDFRSAQQVHALLAEQGESIGLATVYRALALMAEQGDVDALMGEDGETRYRRCSGEHHHHLVCVDCGSTVEISGADVERWAREVGAEHGFTDITHTVELFGRCPDCSRRRSLDRVDRVDRVDG